MRNVANIETFEIIKTNVKKLAENLQDHNRPI